MASCQQSRDTPPPYSRRPTINERVLAIAPDFSLAVDAIQVVQETFPGTTAEDAWGFIQRLARLVRADIRNRRGASNPNQGVVPDDTQESSTGSDPSSDVPEDSPMPNAT